MQLNTPPHWIHCLHCLPATPARHLSFLSCCPAVCTLSHLNSLTFFPLSRSPACHTASLSDVLRCHTTLHTYRTATARTCAALSALLSTPHTARYTCQNIFSHHWDVSTSLSHFTLSLVSLFCLSFAAGRPLSPLTPHLSHDFGPFHWISLTPLLRRTAHTVCTPPEHLSLHHGLSLHLQWALTRTLHSP